MSQLSIKGTIHKIGQKEIKSDKLTVRELVVKHGSEQYPEFIPFQLKNDRCALVDLAKEGDEVEVHFNIRGREWNGKYFANLEAWKLSINQGI